MGNESVEKCASCGSAAVPGSRWCALCHTNLLQPSVGRLASPGKRLGAFLLDLAVPATLLFLLFGGVLAGGAAGGDSGGAFTATLAILVLLAFIVWALVLFSRGETPGKKLLGMRVVKESGAPAGFFTMLVRETIGKMISGAILSLGYLWILLDKERQAWHDKLMSTFVVEVGQG